MIFVLELLKSYPEASLYKGDSSFCVKGVSHVEKLEKDHLVFLKNKVFLKKFDNFLSEHKDFNLSKLLIVIEEKVKDEISDEKLEEMGAVIIVPSVDEALCHFSKIFYDKKFKNSNLVKNFVSEENYFPQSVQIADNVFIGENVQIGENVIVMSGVTLMSEVSIGDGTIIYPNVTIYPYVKIGKNCRIHSQVSIGADGFGYNFIAGKHLKVWHLGAVEISDDVEIGSNSCIDAGTFQPTRIGAGTKIDNHVQVAHNCQVGEHVILCGHVALAGSCQIGNYCVFGGKSGAGPGVILEDGVQVGGGALVNRNWEAGSKLGGYPAFEVRSWMKSVAEFKKLGERKRT